MNSYDNIFYNPKRGGKKKKIHSKGSENDDNKGWREMEMQLWHHNYTTEALSWKGYDVGLTRLVAGKYGKRANGSVAPACLPAGDYDMEQYRKHTYFAGWGRRFSPYCLTDDLGPESQAVCGSNDCSFDPRTDQCLLNFLYNGKKHRECLTCHETPSLSDPICKNLLDSLPLLEKERKKMHIFQNGTYITTCYPRVDKENGWCAIQTPGKEQKEPEPNKGWGFCSNAPDQKYCNKYVEGGSNSTAFRVEALSKEYCVTELGANLAHEQPDVPEEEYNNVEDDYGVFCVADNHTHLYTEDLYFEINADGKYEAQAAKQEYITQLRQNSTTKPYDINGRICYGDSGGPVFQLVYDPQDNVVRPVIIGVFSFVLWGPCHGRHEPAYIMKLQFLEDWLRLYIKEDEACWIGANGRPVKTPNAKTSSNHNDKKTKKKEVLIIN